MTAGSSTPQSRQFGGADKESPQFGVGVVMVGDGHERWWESFTLLCVGRGWAGWSFGWEIFGAEEVS